MLVEVVAEVVHPLAGIVVNWLCFGLVEVVLSGVVAILMSDVILYVDMEVDDVFLMSSFLGFFVLLFVYYC